MNTSRKLLILALATVFLIGATPALAQLAGTWAGTGTGSCSPRPGIVIYPWQNWKGEIPSTEDVFEGDWWDSDDNRGIFKGEVEYSVIPEIATAEGSWYWFDPTGPANRPVYGGEFEMTFYFLDGRCEGIWTSIWPSPSSQGTMQGRKVE